MPHSLQAWLQGCIFLVCPERRASVRAFGSPPCGSFGALGELSLQEVMSAGFGCY